ncbi:MAG: LysR family transcriptional regulator [Rhodocyclaceae bacterium]|nr:LysR family transcriptional regulator [Rhodocyclaceae bacterium]
MESCDLRLLKIFEEIHKTRSVTRAAINLGLGQPAVSVALGRLRRHYNDPLFVRTSNGMEPSAVGAEVAERIREAVAALERALGHQARFDPGTARRSFAIAMTDISQLVLLPALLERLRRLGPGIVVDVDPLSAETARKLETGDIDLALGFMPQLEAGFYQQALFRQNYVCLVGSRHPRVHNVFDRAGFEREEHAVVTTSGTGHLIIDAEIARQRIQRRVALRVPNFLGAVSVVEATDLVVTVPVRLGELMVARGHCRAFPVPFDLPDYLVKQHWHERNHLDPANQWLRGLIYDLLHEVRAPV